MRAPGKSIRTSVRRWTRRLTAYGGAMLVDPMSPMSLYDALAEPALASAPLGETNITKAKETADNDAETFDRAERELVGVRV
jgi:hypothetical protein